MTDVRRDRGAIIRARRIQEIRARCRVRNWEYRQRNLAHGAWGRFREALAQAATAYAVDDATFERLVAEGNATDDRGARLEPPRRIVWITNHRAALLDASQELEMRLDGAMLGACNLALVPFPRPA